MIDKLLGSMLFDNGFDLTQDVKGKEIELEEKNLDLFTYNSPSKLAKGLGNHLSSFSKKCFGLPPYLYLIDDWISGYYTIIEVEKDFKKCRKYPEKELQLYLLHKVFMRKIVYQDVFSKKEVILERIAHIKSIAEGQSLVGKAKKYLGIAINPYQLSGTDFEAINQEINELKQGVN